jgi:hypothetical protein
MNKINHANIESENRFETWNKQKRKKTETVYPQTYYLIRMRNTEAYVTSDDEDAGTAAEASHMDRPYTPRTGTPRKRSATSAAVINGFRDDERMCCARGEQTPS